MDAGSQVIALTDTLLLKPTLSTSQTFGFIRKKGYGVNDQPFGSTQTGINTFGSTYFPGTARFVNGWALQGLTVLQSGQPYSVIDYSGAVGRIYYGVADGITNPIVPLAPGCTPQSAKTGASGAFTQGGGLPALKASCFTLPTLAPGALNGGISTNDAYETNFTTGQPISSASRGTSGRYVAGEESADQ
jgi:hypothetical protein